MSASVTRGVPHPSSLYRNVEFIACVVEMAPSALADDYPIPVRHYGKTAVQASVLVAPKQLTMVLMPTHPTRIRGGDCRARDEPC